MIHDHPGTGTMTTTDPRPERTRRRAASERSRDRIQVYVPIRHGASLMDRLGEVARTGRFLRLAAGSVTHGRVRRTAYNLRAAAGTLRAAASPRGPRYLQTDGTRTWGSQGRPVSPRVQDRLDRRMAASRPGNAPQ
jgi:hypothetical protein